MGVIRELGDGVAKIEGLTDAMLNEMIDLGNGITGLALNLEETEVGVIILGDYTQLTEGGEARTTGKLLQVPVGKGLLGRVVNMLGEPVDGKGPIKSDAAYPVEKIAPGIIRRQSVNQPVQTGIMAIDAMIPIGRGQRELIIGDRATGKTTICIDTIINQARLNKAAEVAGDKEYRPLYCIYVAIGQKQSNVARVIAVLEEAGAMPYTIIVASPASDSAANQYLAPFAGAAMGEWFMDNGMDALIVYRRSVQARRGVSAGLARAEAAVGPRGVSRRRVLPAQPPAGTRRAGRREVRQRLADGASHHRDAGGRRVGLHPDQRHLDHGRPDLSGDRSVLPGRAARPFRSVCPSPASVRRPSSRP